MTTHRIVSKITVGVLMLGIVATGVGQSSFAQQSKETELELLYVQNGTQGSFDGTRLTLKGVGPTLFFTDRPQRVTGHVRTSYFVDQWSKGSDNFAADPPNATLSTLGEKTVNSAVVELFDPELKGMTLSYRVKVLGGTIPPTFKEGSLFIDRIGRGGAFIMGGVIGGAIAHSATKSSEAAKTANQPQTVVVTQPDYYVRSTSPPPGSTQSVEKRLQTLDQLLANGYITKQEHAERKQAILDSI